MTAKYTRQITPALPYEKADTFTLDELADALEHRKDWRDGLLLSAAQRYALTSAFWRYAMRFDEHEPIPNMVEGEPIPGVTMDPTYHFLAECMEDLLDSYCIKPADERLPFCFAAGTGQMAAFVAALRDRPALRRRKAEELEARIIALHSAAA